MLESSWFWVFNCITIISISFIICWLAWIIQKPFVKYRCKLGGTSYSSKYVEFQFSNIDELEKFCQNKNLYQLLEQIDD